MRALPGGVEVGELRLHASHRTGSPPPSRARPRLRHARLRPPLRRPARARGRRPRRASSCPTTRRSPTCWPRWSSRRARASSRSTASTPTPDAPVRAGRRGRAGPAGERRRAARCGASRVTGEPLDLAALAGRRARPARRRGRAVRGRHARGARARLRGLRRDGASRSSRRSRAEEAERHGLCAVAVEHRTGTVPLGEPSVIVAASAPHRGEAFAGARALIDRVKAEAPIWKVEVDGADRAARRGHAAADVAPAGAGEPPARRSQAVSAASS